MPAVARANGTDGVLSPDGTGKDCAFPMNVTTGPATQGKVTADKVPVVIAGNIPSTHMKLLCKEVDKTPLMSSSKVFVTGKAIGRIGDMYGPNIITSGSSKVFSN